MESADWPPGLHGIMARAAAKSHGKAGSDHRASSVYLPVLIDFGEDRALDSTLLIAEVPELHLVRQVQRFKQDGYFA